MVAAGARQDAAEVAGDPREMSYAKRPIASNEASAPGDEWS